MASKGHTLIEALIHLHDQGLSVRRLGATASKADTASNLNNCLSSTISMARSSLSASWNGGALARFYALHHVGPIDPPTSELWQQK